MSACCCATSERGCGARHGAGEDEVDHAAHQVQGQEFTCCRRTKRWTSYPVFQGISPTVLLPNDGRDGEWRRFLNGPGDGDAGQQCGAGDRADHAGGSHGEGLALCDSRRRTHDAGASTIKAKSSRSFQSRSLPNAGMGEVAKQPRHTPQDAERGRRPVLAKKDL